MLAASFSTEMAICANFVNFNFTSLTHLIELRPKLKHWQRKNWFWPKPPNLSGASLEAIVAKFYLNILARNNIWKRWYYPVSKVWKLKDIVLGLILLQVYSVNFTLHYFFKHFDWLLTFFNQSECLKNSKA